MSNTPFVVTHGAHDKILQLAYKPCHVSLCTIIGQKKKSILAKDYISEHLT